MPLASENRKLSQLAKLFPYFPVVHTRKTHFQQPEYDARVQNEHDDNIRARDSRKETERAHARGKLKEAIARLCHHFRKVRLVILPVFAPVVLRWLLVQVQGSETQSTGRNGTGDGEKEETIEAFTSHAHGVWRGTRHPNVRLKRRHGQRQEDRIDELHASKVHFSFSSSHVVGTKRPPRGERRAELKRRAHGAHSSDDDFEVVLAESENLLILLYFSRFFRHRVVKNPISRNTRRREDEKHQNHREPDPQALTRKTNKFANQLRLGVKVQQNTHYEHGPLYDVQRRA